MNVLSPLRPVLLALVLPMLVVPSLADSATAQSATARAPDMPTLVSVRAFHGNGEDRVVFHFRGPLPKTQVKYVDRLFADGSGRRVRVPGRAILRVRFEPAQAHTEQGVPTAAPRRRAFALPNVMTAVRAGDFEGVTTYGLGLAKRTRVKVSTQPRRNRVVVRMSASFRTVKRQVWFLDRHNFISGQEPYFVPTNRQVPAMSPATGVMDRLFAGPTPSEQRNRGLTLIRSGATGFDDLAISGGIAKVRLLGKCSSGGSTATIAGEILPTLRQFASVDWVKVYDRAGTTLDPTGAGDSTPACLEP